MGSEIRNHINLTNLGEAVAAESSATESMMNREADQTEVDGGTKAWLRVFGSFMVFVNIWGIVFIFGVFQSFYELSYIPSESPSSISWIGTIQSALLSILGVFTGPLYDKGEFRRMSIAGSLLVLFGLAMMSLSVEYWQLFLSQGICIGLGGGLLYVPCLVLVNRSFQKRRPVAMGILTCGIGIGGVIHVAVFQSLLPRIGFAWTVRVLLLIEAIFFGIGMTAFHFSTPKQGRSVILPRLFDVAALKDSAFQAYSAAAFLTFLGYLVPFFYIPSYAQVNLGASVSTSFWLLAISSASSIVGRLGSALVAQRLGIMLSWLLCITVSAALCFSWIAIQDLSTFYAFCALYGCFSGALVTLPAAIFPRICLNTENIGSWMGMSWFASGISFLIGAPIAGALIKTGTSGLNQFNFLPVQLWSGCLLSGGTGLVGVLWMALFRRSLNNQLFF